MPVGPGLVHDLDALAEAGEALADAREAVAVGAPLVLVPAGADAHLDAAAGDDVDRRRDLREVRGVAVAHAGAHLAEPHPVRRGGERGHEGPGLVRGLVRGHRHGVEVVVDPDRLPGALVRERGDAVHGRPVLGGIDADEVVPPALGHEHPEPQRLAHGSDGSGLASNSLHARS